MKPLTSIRKFELIDEMMEKSDEEVLSCLMKKYYVSQKEADQFLQFLSTEKALENEVAFLFADGKKVLFLWALQKKVFETFRQENKILENLFLADTL